MDREWDGLIARGGDPLRSLEKKIAERQIRGLVVTRKNAGGSRNGGTARNAARIWTVTATAAKAGLNLQTYLAAYLDECGRNNGRPPDGAALERFLPWAASPEDLPGMGTAAPGPGNTRLRDNTITGVADSNRHARRLACPFTGLPNTYAGISPRVNAAAVTATATPANRRAPFLRVR